MDAKPRQLSRILLYLFVSFVLFLNLSGEKTISAEETATIIQKRAVYLIGNGDLLNVITWTGAEFTKEEVVVRIDGKITLPLLNDIQATDKTPVQLKKEIEKGLSVFVESPTVTVIVKKQASKKFYVLGEALHSGEYHLEKQLTVIQAIAKAGGFTEKASKDEILLIRENIGGNVTFRINYSEIMKGKNLSSNMQIQTDDTIIIP